MNVLDLQNLGVEEMNEMEVRDVEGGAWWWGPAIAMSLYLYDNRDRFADGFMSAF